MKSTRERRQPGSGWSIRGVIWLVHSSDYLWEIVSPTYSNCFKTCELLKKYVFTPSPKFVVCGSLATFCGSRLYSLRSIHWYPSHLQYVKGLRLHHGAQTSSQLRGGGEFTLFMLNSCGMNSGNLFIWFAWHQFRWIHVFWIVSHDFTLCDLSIKCTN